MVKKGEEAFEKSGYLYDLANLVDTALAIRIKINKLPKIKELQNFEPKVSIGIKSGEMISGNIGSESLKRLDYTVIGDTVNTAARLQDAAEENQILICEDCYQKIKEAFKCRQECLFSRMLFQDSGPLNSSLKLSMKLARMKMSCSTNWVSRSISFQKLLLSSLRMYIGLLVSGQ